MNRLVRLAHPAALSLVFLAALNATALRAQTFLYWDLNNNVAGAGGGTMPSSTWTTGDARWNMVADGTGITFPWFNNAVAVFSAGTNATGAYTVSVGTPSGIIASGFVMQDGTVTLGGTGTLTMVNPLPGIAPALNHGNANVTIGSGVTIAGLAGFTFGGSGTGAVSLNGDTTVLGTTTIAGTTVTLGAAERLSDVSLISLASDGVLNLANFNETIGGLGGSGSVTLGTGNLTISQLSDSSFTGTISGTGGVTKSGPGTLTITKAAGWTGPTSITNGTLSLGASHLLPDTTVLPISTDGTLLLGSSSEKLAGITGLGSVGLTGGTLELAGNSGYNFGGTISGFGQLLKSGAGTFILNGSGNWAGTASIDGGTLRLGGNERLANALDVGIGAGATLDVNGATESIDALTGKGTVTLGGGTLAVGSNHAIFTLDATVTGPGTLTKSGNGIATLTGTFGPSGSLSVIQGTFALGASERLGNSVDVFVNAGAGLSLSGFTETINTLNGLGNVGLGSGALLVTGNTDATYSGVISGTGTFTKSGTGTLTLLGASTYTGLTTVSAGRLLLIGDNRLAHGADAHVAAGATIELSDSDGDGSQYFGAVTGAGDLTENSLYGLTIGLGVDNSSFTFGGRLRGSVQYAKMGSGTLSLTGQSDYSGDLQILSGNVRLEADHALSTSPIAGTAIALTTTLELNGHAQLLYDVSGFGTIDLGNTGTGALTLSTSSPSLPYRFDGAITGLGSLDKTGGRTTTLAGPLNFSGPTHIYNGRLRLEHSGTVDTDIEINASSALDLAGSEITIDQLIGGGTVTFDGGQLVVGSGNGTFGFPGILQGGTGSRFVKQGTGTLTLSGSTSVESHVVNNGTLLVGADNAFATTSSVQIQPGKIFDLGNHPTTINALTGTGQALTGTAAFGVGAGGASFTFNGEINGTGALTKSGNGTFTLAGLVKNVASLAVANGQLALGGNERLHPTLPVSLVNNGSVFDVAGFTQTIGAFTGSGVLKIPTGSLLNTGNGNASFTYSGSIEGAGAFAKIGSGTLTFAGKTNGAAEILVSGGRLLLPADDRFDSKAKLVVNAPGLFDTDTRQQEFDQLAGDGTVRIEGAGRLRAAQGLFTGTLQGTGTLEKVGAAQLVLEQPQSTTTKLRASAGQLALANAGTWTFGDIAIVNTGALSTVGAATVNAPLANAGVFHSNGVTTLTGAVSGIGSFTGDLVLQGSLAPGASSGQAALVSCQGNVTLASSHTLHLEIGGLTPGSQHDALGIDNDLTLGGTLHLSLVGGFTPSAGQVFTVLSATHINGNFANYDLPALAHGLAWDTSRLRVDGTLRVVSGYAAFVAAAGLDLNTNGAPLANPSGDGIANVLKYLLGGDPRVAQPNLLPIGTVETNAGGTVLVFAYTRDALAAATLSSVSVQSATDLTAWADALAGANGVTVTITPDGYLEHVVYRIPIAGNRGFARLRASL